MNQETPGAGPGPASEQPQTEQPQAEQSQFDAEITPDDKLWTLLAYILTPIVPIILLLLEDKKSRPFIRAHNAQALAIGILQVILWALAFTCVTAILGLLLFIAQIYWGIQAYQGRYVSIPVLTDFVKNQGWA